MKKLIVFALLVSTFLVSSCTLRHIPFAKPSQLETVMALKNILNSSTFKALNSLRSANKNGIEGAVPAEVATVLDLLKTLGYSDQVNQVTNSINSVSGVMLKEGEGIINDAISEIKFTDAVAVVMGGEDAATRVLKKTMYETIKKRYSAQMQEELAKTEALDYWPLAAGAYNVFAKEKVDSSLSDFLAERAVDAIFLAMGKQEANIRTDYKSLGDTIVTKVFDYYTKNQ